MLFKSESMLDNMNIKLFNNQGKYNQLKGS
uniref:Uncharacterized protein n=1 Tax=Tetranychus urticae TaxID=32264 RepID=T1L356_TETUR